MLNTFVKWKLTINKIRLRVKSIKYPSPENASRIKTLKRQKFRKYIEFIAKFGENKISPREFPKKSHS